MDWITRQTLRYLGESIEEIQKVSSKTIDVDAVSSSNPMLSAAFDIITELSKHGEAYIVGGAVRDLLMGKDPKDVDIVTSLDPEEVEKIYPNQHDIGKNKNFGISVVEHNGFDFEVATYRKDEYGDELGKGASTVSRAQSFKDDSSRRDFNFNAMGIDKDGNIIDYHGGLNDIENKILNTVGDPDRRFAEDYVRMLRAIRFASRLGFTINPEVEQAIKKNSSKITGVASERITKELLSMASQSGDKFAESLMMMYKFGILDYIIPEISKMDTLDHSKEHHPEGNVLQHTIEALKSNKLSNPIINLAILFHDIGKLTTQSIGTDGLIHYYDHAEQAVELIDQIATRLRLDNKTKEAMTFAAVNHMKFHEITKMSPNKVLKLMDSPYWDILVSTSEADAKARGQLFDTDEWNNIMKHISDIKSRFEGQKSLASLKALVNGNWVMQLRGIKKPNREVGEIINKTVGWIVDNNIDINDKELIGRFIKNI